MYFYFTLYLLDSIESNSIQILHLASGIGRLATCLGVMHFAGVIDLNYRVKI